MRCPLDTCEEELPHAYALLCRYHWRLVRPRLKQTLFAAYTAGQEGNFDLKSSDWEPLVLRVLQDAYLAEKIQRSTTIR